MKQPTDQELAQALLDLELATKTDLENLLQSSQQQAVDFASLLVQKNTISEKNLGKVFAELLKIPFIELQNTPIDQEVLLSIPYVFAKQNQVVAFADDSEYVKVAASRPWDTQLQLFLKRKYGSGRTIIWHFASKSDILHILADYQTEIANDLEEEIATYVEKAHESKGKAAEPPIIKVVDTLFKHGYNSKASDIHIEPEEEQSFIRFRIDGILHDILSIPPQIHSQVVTRIKVMSKLRTDEHQAPQDGKIALKLDDETADVRVSIVPTTNGEKVVMRLLSERSRQFSLTDLGLSDSDLQQVQAAAEKPHGMILSTGPTGSGKTTTLYAILKLLNDRDVNIMTIEDPVEYDLEGINQIQVNKKTELTFANGLRSIVRQDPDIILVGEIRDQETAEIAINSAMTGHIVLSSVHTNDAATTIPRLIDMEVEPFLIASSVNVIVAQRLVRKICLNCRHSKTVKVADITTKKKETEQSLSRELSRESVIKQFGDVEEIRIYEGKGCEVCHLSGYQGRIGVFEVLVMTDGIQEAVVAQKDAGQIAELARGEGMVTMIEDGLAKVKEGITTIDEILRVTKEA